MSLPKRFSFNLLSIKLLVGGLGIGSLLAFGALFTHIVAGSGLSPDQQLKFAMNLLDEGRWDLAGRLVRDLSEQGRVDTEQSAAWQYVQGVAELQSVADELDTPRNRKVLLEATRCLKQAANIGFPLGFQGKGRFYLGYCLFHTYRWEAAIAELADVAELWPERRSDALRMIFSSHIGMQPPNFVAAEQTLTTWRAIPGLSASERARIDLATAQLLLSLGRVDECEQRLILVDESLAEYSEAQTWRGRWRIVDSADPDQPDSQRQLRAREAEEILRKVVVSAVTPNVLRRQAAYLSGINMRQQGRSQEALSTFSGVRQRSPQSAEAIASGIEEAEILLELGGLEEAVSTAHHILRNIDHLELYNGYWVSADALRSRLLAIGRRLRDQHEYERVIQLAKYIELAYPLSESVRLQAETYERWGRDLLEEPKSAIRRQRSAHRQLVADRFLLAAERYQTLAMLELRSTEYPEILWHTIENFQYGNEIRRANTLLAEYLRCEDRVKRPRGFLALGRNHMNAGNWEQALVPLERCLEEYPTNPVSFEARLLAAKAKAELGDMENAAELLRSNMADFQLDPRSPVWQDSLFELGNAIFQRAEQLQLASRQVAELEPEKNLRNLQESHDYFLKSIQSLNEAISRYPKDPRYYEARYMIAKAYQLAAEMPRAQAIANSSLVDATRRAMLVRERDLLERALEGFRTLHQAINAREESLSSEKNLPILRNSYFGEADTLFELDRWEDAIQAYRNAASRFLNRPESLEALAQMAVCHRKLGREFEAKKTLAQAEQVLRRIPPEYDSHFVAHTRANRLEWQELLGWLKAWD